MKREQIEKYRDEFEHKAEKYYREYQETGSPGKEKTQHRYEDMTDICTLALKEKEEEDTERQRRIRNINKYCEQLQEIERLNKGIMYTTQQVINMIKGFE